MDLLGSNVIYLPISGLREFEDTTIPFFKKKFPTISSKHPRIKCLMQYATKKGIKNAKGPLVVLDYTSSGKTLRTVCKILEEKGDINPQKIKPHSLNEDIKTISKQKGTINEREIDFLLEDLRYSRYENISNTPHFQYNDLYDDEYCKKTKHEIFKIFDDFSQKEARAWILCAAYEAMKLIDGERNENSSN